MRRFRIVSVAAVLFGLCTARPAAAQQPAPTAAADRATITIGVSQLHETYGSGWGGDIEMSGGRTWTALRMSLIVDAGLNLFDGFSELTVMGGVRFGPRGGGVVRPFGQFMAGIENCHACTTTDPTFEPAAGVDVAIGHNGRLSLRGEVGYRITPSDRRTFTETHVLIGLTLALGASRKN